MDSLKYKAFTVEYEKIISGPDTQSLRCKTIAF